jgi:hypothetical protein
VASARAQIAALVRNGVLRPGPDATYADGDDATWLDVDWQALQRPIELLGRRVNVLDTGGPTQPTSSAGTGGELWSWTYAKSQKVRNLERDRRCTLQVETGTEYSELRGVMLACEAVIHRDLDTVSALGADIAARYGGADLTPELEAAMRKQAAKRVGLQFVERRRASWDHRKLGGTY